MSKLTTLLSLFFLIGSGTVYSQCDGFEQTITIEHVSCPGEADAFLLINATGGAMPYFYTINNSDGEMVNDAGSNIATGLEEGWYYCATSESSFVGCLVWDSVYVSSPEPITIDFTTSFPTCEGDCDAYIVVDSVYNAGDPASELTYTWTPDPGEVSGTGADSNFTACPGDYRVKITNTMGCSDSFDITVIENPDPLAFATLNVDQHASATENGIVTAEGTGGNPEYSYLWTWLDYPEFTETTPTWEELGPGLYEIQLSDESGCRLIDTVEVLDLGGWVSLDEQSMTPEVSISYNPENELLYLQSEVSGELVVLTLSGQEIGNYVHNGGKKQLHLLTDLGITNHAFYIYQWKSESGFKSSGMIKY